MKAIKDLAEMMSAEVDDAEEYAKCALRWKDEDSRLSEMYAKLSSEELVHADLEHEQAVRLIKEYDGNTPDGMRAVWDWEHERLIERQSKVRILLEMVRG